MSKPLVHIRMSDKDDFLNEHEIFEMMRSRQLYQMQFELRRKLEKRIRAIELAEKVHISTFQSKKTVFLNKMREKIRQKNLKRYYKQIGNGEEESENEKDLISENRSCEQVQHVLPEMSNDKVRNSIRPKSLLTILNAEHSDRTERPVTSRSVVSLHGKTFPVATSLGRKQLTGSKALISEVTIYPGDFISHIAEANDNSVQAKNQTDDQRTDSQCKEILVSKTIKFTFDAATAKCLKDKSVSLPLINPDAIKNLATFEMGTLTPEGNLILTQEDYNAYMQTFESKREKRLRRVRRLCKSLDQKVRDFRIKEEKNMTEN